MPSRKTIKYAVVGLGHIAQSAVLPAFKNATRNSELAALVSDDPLKLRKLGAKYGVQARFSYKEFDRRLKEVDAVYIAVPNSLHRKFTEQAANAGVHVLCEKPLAVTTADCRAMIAACARAKVKLMTAYRLHFEEANLQAIEVVRSGRIGDPQIFSSVFTMQVRPGNIRVKRRLGGGPLYDIGIYCINAARYLFQAEPVEATCTLLEGKGERFREIEKGASAVLRFEEERVAAFTCSFGAADASFYTVVGTRGRLEMTDAYELAAPIRQVITVDSKSRERTSPQRDQFGPELVYFSDCILNNVDPEPSGEEGWADIRVIEALLHSAGTRRPVILPRPPKRRKRPSMGQEIRRPPSKKGPLVRVAAPTL